MEAAREGVGLRKRCSLRTFTSISGPTHLRRSGFYAAAAGVPAPAMRERLPDTGVEGGADTINVERPRDGNGKKANRAAPWWERLPFGAQPRRGSRGLGRFGGCTRQTDPPTPRYRSRVTQGLGTTQASPSSAFGWAWRVRGHQAVHASNSRTRVPEEPAPKCSAVTLTKRTCMCWGSPRTGSWAVSAALILVRLPCHVQPACVELSQSHFGLKPGQSLGGNLRLQDLSCSGLHPDRAKWLTQLHPAGHLPCSRRSAICSRGQVWLSGSSSDAPDPPPAIDCPRPVPPSGDGGCRYPAGVRLSPAVRPNSSGPFSPLEVART